MTAVVPAEGVSDVEVVAMAYALQAGSEHPLAASARRRADAEGVRQELAMDFRAHAGG